MKSQWADVRQAESLGKRLPQGVQIILRPFFKHFQGFGLRWVLRSLPSFAKLEFGSSTLESQAP